MLTLYLYAEKQTVSITDFDKILTITEFQLHSIGLLTCPGKTYAALHCVYLCFIISISQLIRIKIIIIAIQCQHYNRVNSLLWCDRSPKGISGRSFHLNTLKLHVFRFRQVFENSFIFSESKVSITEGKWAGPTNIIFEQAFYFKHLCHSKYRKTQHLQ